ncbi:hypothetical protein [Archangium violaceum]|nr:hypothetical protein [Archangium violaceum]
MTVRTRILLFAAVLDGLARRRFRQIAIGSQDQQRSETPHALVLHLA